MVEDRMGRFLGCLGFTKPPKAAIQPHRHVRCMLCSSKSVRCKHAMVQDVPLLQPPATSSSSIGGRPYGQSSTYSGGLPHGRSSNFSGGLPYGRSSTSSGGLPYGRPPRLLTPSRSNHLGMSSTGGTTYGSLPHDRNRLPSEMPKQYRSKRQGQPLAGGLSRAPLVKRALPSPKAPLSPTHLAPPRHPVRKTRS